jgi:hypothetical protein
MLAITTVSIIVAGDFQNIFDIMVRIFEGGEEYCNSSLSHAAACIILYNGGVLSPFLVILAIVAYWISGLSKEVPKSLFETAKYGRMKHGSEANDLQTQNISNEKNKDTKKGLASIWSNYKEKYRVSPQNSLTYEKDFEDALLSPWRYILYGIGLILCYAIAIKMQVEVGLQYAGLPILIIAGYFFVIIIPIFVAYFFTVWIWFFFVVGNYLRWLPRIFKLDIQPNHGDNCGGFKRLGDICFKMALSIILPAVLLGIWVGTGIVAKASEKVPSFAFFIFIVIVILLVLSFWAFFYPILGIHTAMAKKKARYQDESAAKIHDIESRLRSLYEREEYESKKIKLLLEQLELAKTLYPTDVRYPTWPFSIPILLGFFTTQIVPIFGAITLLVEFLELFK